MNDSHKIFLSPLYLMQLVKEVEKKICEKFPSLIDTRYYISKWQEVTGYWENFSIYQKSNGDIDLKSTLHSIKDGEILIKIAIDLGVQTPGFIPSIPLFRNEIKSNYENANQTFEKAFTQIEEHPDIAIGLANSALESIIKEILKDERLNSKINSNKTLYELTSDVLKEFQLYPSSEMPIEIKTIGSSLLAASQNIEKLRSDKTNFHGKTNEDYIIKDSIYTYFIFNSVVTIGLFLLSFYKNKFPKQSETSLEILDNDDLPF